MKKEHGLGHRRIQLGSLAVVTASLFFLGKHVPQGGSSAGLAAALGLLLLAGVLFSELLDLLRLPHLTGYLVAGVVSGPSVLHFVNHDTVIDLSQINELALALIALSGGLELRVNTLREVRRSLTWATLVQTTVVFIIASGAFFLLRHYIPFARALPDSAAAGVALLWGVLAVSRSPSAVLGIVSQAKPSGPLTRYSIAFVMSSDIVVVLLMALAMLVAKPLILPGSGFSLDSLVHLMSEVYGSIVVGTSLGLALTLYLRFVGRHLLMVLLLLGFGFTEGVRYLHLEPLLTFITAGFVVQNLSRQGDRLLHAIEETGAIVFVVFFATAGAHLDLHLLAQLWPIALALFAARAASTWISQRLSSKLANDPPVIRRFGWASMISQAGLTLGLSVVVERTFPSLGSDFRSLVIASVAINEIVGPILFKFALDKTGESGGAMHPVPNSLGASEAPASPQAPGPPDQPASQHES